MKELERHKDAFEAYYKSRNITEIARNFRVSARALHTWKKEFNWEERCLIRDREVSDGLEKKIIPGLIEERAKKLEELRQLKQITKAAIQTSFERNPDGTLKKTAAGNPILKLSVQKIKDLRDLSELEVKIIESELKVMGEPEKIEHKGELKVIFEDAETDEKDKN